MNMHQTPWIFFFFLSSTNMIWLYCLFSLFIGLLFSMAIWFCRCQRLFCMYPFVYCTNWPPVTIWLLRECVTCYIWNERSFLPFSAVLYFGSVASCTHARAHSKTYSDSIHGDCINVHRALTRTNRTHIESQFAVRSAHVIYYAVMKWNPIGCWLWTAMKKSTT